jgi:hypothetical protein
LEKKLAHFGATYAESKEAPTKEFQSSLLFLFKKKI